MFIALTFLRKIKNEIKGSSRCIDMVAIDISAEWIVGRERKVGQLTITNAPLNPL